ncbi:MAG TPA: methylmalonyl Co-A mutase-associated GTPase MeaB [Candidatus Udaeobacter sp.]|jgi:LAO/AO transport system kinase|nr:methylmalonyl Co-A mutase-associated GTPase MeaB [Candidatus Udaeobacter sp.]
MTGKLVSQILKGDVRALASLMSLIEDGDPKVKAVLKAVYSHTGRAHVIGVTGAAGTGKSSLIAGMTAEYRRRQKTVGILAVDPTSLFTTGALLGDRIRMRDHFADADVFIRSFATRGNSGGLSAAVREAVHLLDAAGKETVFVETIGVGQDQLEIAALAQMVVVVLTPQMGDEVQGMKAGLAEIADILVVNKADLSGTEETVQQLKALFADEDFPIVATSATNNQGVDLLVERIEQQRSASFENGKYERKRVNLCRQELLSLLRQRIFAELAKKVADDSLETQIKRVAERKIDPYSAVAAIAKKIGL